MFEVAKSALMWQDGLRNVEPLMVGSGGGGTTYQDLACPPNYFIYGFQARVGSGKLLLSGFSLMADRPESIYLLDEFIRYVQSDVFTPQGTFDPADITWAFDPAVLGQINGWSKTVQAAEHISSYYSFIGQLPMDLVRQTDDKTPLLWLTAPTPSGVKKSDRFVFRFLAMTGYESQPGGGKFSLYVRDPERPEAEPTHLLDFDHTMQSARWSGMAGWANLDYKVIGTRASEDSSGIMELSLPTSLLTPGKPVELQVVGKPSNSRRYFGVYQYP
jgi:hypothetical protein